MDRTSPQEIIVAFKTNSLQSWHHYEHIVICIHFAMTARNIYELYKHIFCGLIRFKSLSDKTYTHARCTERFNATISWFWCSKILDLVRRNPGKETEELVSIAEKEGFLNKDLIYNEYPKGIVHTLEAATIPLQLQ